MIDVRTIRFFQGLDKSNTSNHHFFEEVFDIAPDKLSTMHDIAKTIHIPPRTRKRYRWFNDDHTGNLYSVDLCNTDGVPAHEHYQKIFTGSAVDEPHLQWADGMELFRDILAPIGKQWRWVMLVRIDPMGWWGPHVNVPADKDKDYTLYWIPLNQVKNRFFASQNSGYFEPQAGKAYIQRGHIYEYSTINLGLEPMYNITGVCE